jgi:hypothetical protein
MTNRTILLVIGTSLSLTLGSLPSTLRAQQPQPTLTPAQQQQRQQQIEADLQRAAEQLKSQSDPTNDPHPPIIPPKYTTDKPPPWREFFDENKEYLIPFIFAAVVTLAFAVFIWAPVVLCRSIMRASRSCRAQESKDGPQAPPSVGRGT